MNLSVWVPGWNGCGFYGQAAYYGFYPYFPRYGYGYGPLGYGRWYSGGDTAIIVIDGGPIAPIEPQQPHGRVVKGEGYTQGRSEVPTPTPTPSSDSSGSSSSTSSSSSSNSGGSGATTSSSGGERTAHPR